MSIFNRFKVSPEKQDGRMHAELDELFQRITKREERRLVAAGMEPRYARNSAASTADMVIRRDFDSWILTNKRPTSVELAWPRPGWDGWPITGYVVRSDRADPPIRCTECDRAAHLFVAVRDPFAPEWITDVIPDLHLDWAQGRFLLDAEVDAEFDDGYYYTLHPCGVPEQAPFAPFPDY